MEKITFTVEDEDGNEQTLELPARYEVCGRCSGKGSHVNPAVDGNGITPEEFAEDPEFAENYFAGVYDVKCEECEGLRAVLVVDEAEAEVKDPAILRLYYEQQKRREYERRERESELRWGY